MPTESRLKSAAKFLARELMGWEIHTSWWDGESWYFAIVIGFRPRASLANNLPDKQPVMKVSDWQPYADTPEGWWQAKMIVEKMRHVGWDFLAATWADYPYNLNPDRPEGAYQAIFWKTKVDFSKKEAFNDILGAAITLAAATALGWKEE